MIDALQLTRRRLAPAIALTTAVLLAGFPAASRAADAPHETIFNYDGYIISGRPVVTAWYGDRVALVIDGETEADANARNQQTMTKIVTALDNLFNTYDDITGFTDIPIGKPLNGRITVESSSLVGGGLGGHDVLGFAVGDGYFEGQYNRVNAGNNAYHQVFFYEAQRNYWTPIMQKIDYATQDNYPESWGWWTVGFNNAMAALVPNTVPGISDLYYNNQNQQQFADAMVGYLDTYLSSPAYTWENTWDRDRLPWDHNTSVNDLMSALIIQMSRDYAGGGTGFIKGLYHEIPRVPDLASDHVDSVGARDNFYIAASRAAGQDLRNYFTNTLKWSISPDADPNYYRWTGASNGQWMTGNNWQALSAVASGPNSLSVNVAIDGETNPLVDLAGNRSVKTLRFDGLVAESFTLFNSVGGASLTIAPGGYISKDISMFVGDQTISSPITLAGIATLTNNNQWENGGNRLIISGTIAGTSPLYITGRAPQAIGDGGVELTNDNSAFTGSMFLDSGRLIVGGNNALGSNAANLMINGGDLMIRAGITSLKPIVVNNTSPVSTTGSATLGGAVTINTGATWRMNGITNSLSLTGAVGGPGDLELTGGTLTLAGSTPNTLGGSINLSGTSTTLVLNKAPGVTAVAGPLTLDGLSEVHLAAGNQISDSSLVTLNYGSVFKMRNFSDHIAGLSSGPGNGTIVENESGSAGSATLTLGDNTTNRYAYKGTIRDGNFQGIDGVLSLAKVGTNTQVLQWENTYTGSTTVSAGTLALEDIGSINSTSNLTVSGGTLLANASTAIYIPVNLTGGTLSGTGRVAAATIVTGGRVSPGDGIDDAGTLHLGMLSLTSASSLDFDLGDASDLIEMTGALTLDGTLSINWLGAGDVAEKYILISGFTGLTNNSLLLGTLPPSLAGYSLGIDNINNTLFLSATAVPEPGMIGVSMLIAGSLALSWRRRV